MTPAKRAILEYLKDHPGVRGDELFAENGWGFTRRAFTDSMTALRQSGHIENRGGQGLGAKWYLPEHPNDELPTLEIRFIDIETDKVNYAITGVRLIRHITLSEVGFTNSVGHIRSSSFLQTERLEIHRAWPTSSTRRSPSVNAKS